MATPAVSTIAAIHTNRPLFTVHDMRGGLPRPIALLCKLGKADESRRPDSYLLNVRRFFRSMHDRRVGVGYHIQ